MSNLVFVLLFQRQLIYLLVDEDVNCRSDRLRVQLKAESYFIRCPL
jgi:hypothetical protein